jgi:multidrug/hemolysin transport system ATP-binding protein
MIIEVENLKKSYGEIKAVNDISFSVDEGSLFSFLGVNGAGKSTTISILTTLLAKDAGNVHINNYDIVKQADKVRSLIGVVFQDSVLDPTISIKDNLSIRGSLYGFSSKKLKEKVDQVIKLTNMKDIEKRPYGQLSGGQQRRADIARSLIHSPKLLFLDEPTTGLDPKTRQDIWSLISNLQKENGMTVFLTTHYMEEAATSDKIVIIHKGKIKAQGTPVELKTAHVEDTVKITLKNGQYIEQKLQKTTDALPIIDMHKNDILNVEIINGTMDDVFINLTEGFDHVS